MDDSDLNVEESYYVRNEMNYYQWMIDLKVFFVLKSLLWCDCNCNFVQAKKRGADGLCDVRSSLVFRNLQKQNLPTLMR